MSLAIDSARRRTVHRHASTASPSELAADVQRVLGTPLATVTLGMRDPKAIAAWANGTRSPRPAQDAALRSLAQIVSLLQTSDAPDVIRAWFSGMNPELDDQAPALVFRTDPVAVMRAAETFIAAG